MTDKTNRTMIRTDKYQDSASNSANVAAPSSPILRDSSQIYQSWSLCSLGISCGEFLAIYHSLISFACFLYYLIL